MPGKLKHDGTTCPYCEKIASFVDSQLIYGHGHHYGMMYVCYGCEAWVGCHRGTSKALGRLANKELREWKREAHKYFDPLWKKKIQQGNGKKYSRDAAYRWLANELGIKVSNCHIGMFDVVDCKKVVEICKRYYVEAV